MRIGVMSDTHGDKECIQRAIELAGPLALWLHAGDYRQDADVLAELAGIPVHSVIGNCDSRNEGLPEIFLKLEGHAIMVTHGHRYHVKDGFQELAWWAKQYEAEIVVFGHTHRSVVHQEDGILYLNPGSLSNPRGGTVASFAVLELLPGEIRPSIIRLT